MGLVVPVFGDQMLNADMVARRGAGFSFRHPLATLSLATLSDALQQMLSREPTNTFRLAASLVAEELEQAGGVDAAVNEILECVRKHVATLGGKRCRDADKVHSSPTLQRNAYAPGQHGQVF